MGDSSTRPIAKRENAAIPTSRSCDIRLDSVAGPDRGGSHPPPLVTQPRQGDTETSGPEQADEAPDIRGAAHRHYEDALPLQVPAAGGSSLAPAFTALVVGGVGVAVGTVFGLVAIGDKSTLDGECGATKKACTSQSDVSALDTNSWVANIGFGVGVVGLAIAGVLFATHHGPEQAASTSLWIAPVVGLGTAGIEGTFQ